MEKKDTGKGQGSQPAEPRSGLNVRHAVRILRAARELETLVAGEVDDQPPLDRALQRYQRAHPKMGRNDRLVLGTAVYQLARHRELLLEAGRELPVGEGDQFILALLDAVPDQDQWGQIRHLPGGVRPWRSRLAWLSRERNQLSAGIAASGNPPLDDSPPEIVDALARLYAVPRWWLAKGPWSTVAEAASELGALRLPQNLTLRVQAHRGRERHQVLETLHGLEIPCRATHRSPWGLTVEGRHNVLATELYRDGTMEVQDEGSQLVACLLDPKPTEKILDLCAGGGGKSLALASAMSGRGNVIAYDTHHGRLRDARKRAKRASLGNIRVWEDFERVRGASPFDQVLADVPCTSSGTLRRNPDSAWRWDRERMTALTKVQAEILDRAAELVRPGGHLIYVTCSLLSPENSEQVSSFIDRHPEYRLSPPGERTRHNALVDVPGAEQGAFRLPANLERYSGDGFFMARFRKEAG